MTALPSTGQPKPRGTTSPSRPVGTPGCTGKRAHPGARRLRIEGPRAQWSVHAVGLQRKPCPAGQPSNFNHKTPDYRDLCDDLFPPNSSSQGSVYEIRTSRGNGKKTQHTGGDPSSREQDPEGKLKPCPQPVPLSPAP